MSDPQKTQVDTMAVAIVATQKAEHFERQWLLAVNEVQRLLRTIEGMERDKERQDKIIADLQAKLSGKPGAGASKRKASDGD